MKASETGKERDLALQTCFAVLPFSVSHNPFSTLVFVLFTYVGGAKIDDNTWNTTTPPSFGRDYHILTASILTGWKDKRVGSEKKEVKLNLGSE